ncbi:MAG: metal ABC transporter permease [Candidatus Velthaea sp.]
MDGLLAPFGAEFMQRGFIAALVVGLLCSTMGTFVVLRKLSFIGDGLAHASFAGIVIAYLKGFNYAIGAGVVSVITALGIGFVHRRAKVSLDTSIGVLFTGAFALGIFLMSRAPNARVDLQSYLFGYILGVSRQDLIVIVTLGIFVAIVVAALYRPLVYTSFDPVVAQASGINATFVDDALLVLLSLTIIVSIQAVGIILVAALLVTPAATAAQLTKRFVPMMVLSACFGVFSAVGGLYLSYTFGSSSGATIVLLATLLFFAAIGVNAVRRRQPAP